MFCPMPYSRYVVAERKTLGVLDVCLWGQDATIQETLNPIDKSDSTAHKSRRCTIAKNTSELGATLWVKRNGVSIQDTYLGSTH